MGYYINPEGESKEAWLKTNASAIGARDAQAFDFSGDSLPVCLVDNGLFTAAGIAYDARERDVFIAEDGRNKWWFSVKRELLKPWYED